MSFASIVSIWVESTGLSYGWYVIAKDNLGDRHTIGDVYVTLEAALAAARHLQAQLA